MKNILKKILQGIDKLYVDPHLLFFGDSPGILCLCFHTVFNNNDEKQNKHTLPNLGLTIDEYLKIFNYFIDHEYKFISFDDFYKNLDPKEKYIHISFDDGYFNNTRILPILEKYNIPCSIFVVMNNILKKQKYWWDIIYNKRLLEGNSIINIYKEISVLQNMHYKKIDEYIINNFGPSSLNPQSDIDRPLTTEELKELNKNDLITIGNHTFNHAMLNNLSEIEVKDQINKAQNEIELIIGERPKSFAFPNNNYNKKNLKILRKLEIDFGFSGDFRHNKIPSGLSGEKKIRLGRYGILENRDMNWQFKMLRAGITPFIFAKELKRKLL